MTEAADRLRDWGAKTAIVLGSGLNSLVEGVPPAHCIPYATFSDLPVSKVAGHCGQFALDVLDQHRVIYAAGRVHLYEGHSAFAVTAGIRLLASAGIERVILTNAAGSLNSEFSPGSWMMITDHLNLTGTSPLLGTAQFHDMSNAYSRQWRSRFSLAAQSMGVSLHEGVYAGLPGPQYETPAEVRMLQRLGADAAGMSTVLETIQARALGLKVAGFSCLTNWGAGIGVDQLSHRDVLATGKIAAAQFSRLLTAALAND